MRSKASAISARVAVARLMPSAAARSAWAVASRSLWEYRGRPSPLWRGVDRSSRWLLFKAVLRGGRYEGVASAGAVGVVPGSGGRDCGICRLTVERVTTVLSGFPAACDGWGWGALMGREAGVGASIARVAGGSAVALQLEHVSEPSVEGGFAQEHHLCLCSQNGNLTVQTLDLAPSSVVGMPYKSTRPTTIRRRAEVGDRLRSLRRSQGLSQQRLGQLCSDEGLDRRSISALENGYGTVTLDAILDLADALRVPVTWLLTDDWHSPGWRNEGGERGGEGS